MDVFIARQAILDQDQQLFGYELLFRSCKQGQANVADDSASTLQVLSTALLSAGLSILSEVTPLFINFGREMLMSSWTSLFPSSVVIIEILESVKADPEVLAACIALKNQGYALALDDVTEASEPEFLNLVDIVKIDFRATSPETQVRLALKHGRAGRRLLAEKVETREEFERAKQLGFHYFQGFFFSKPVLLQGRQMVAMKGNVLRLMLELSSAEINFKRLEELIRHDVSLTYKLLRYVNSALFARTKSISGVLPALVAMGELDIRRWIILVTLMDLGGSQVLASHALIRARFCESLAVAACLRSPADAFLIGMFSLLDALASRPLPDLLSELALPAEIGAPLLGLDITSKNAFVLILAKRYEAGDWDSVAASATNLSIPIDTVAGIYLSAVDWAATVLAIEESAAKSPAPKMARTASPQFCSTIAKNLLALENGLNSKRLAKPVLESSTSLRPRV